MGASDAYTTLPLRGGLLLKWVRRGDALITDALDRPALARTVIVAMTLEVEISAQLTSDETSITLYHEILEAAAVAVPDPPLSVCEFNEAGFESAARQMHTDLGTVSPAKLNLMLELFGF